MTLFFGVLLGVCWGPGPGLAPAGELLSFASPKESSQRKGDPAGCVPSLRYGQPAVLTFRGVSPKLASLKQGRALIRETLRSSAHPEGVGIPKRLRCARLQTANSQQPVASSKDRRPHTNRRRRAAPAAASWPSNAMARVVPPSGCAEERSVSRIRARSCLSEASSARPRETRAPQVARSEAEGRRQWGRLFFAYFLLAKQKKVSRPPGRVPAPGNNKTNSLKAYDCDPLQQTPSHPTPHQQQTPQP